MQVFLLIIIVLVFVILLIVASMRPNRSQLSLFELKHRASSGSESAQKALERENLLDDVMSIQKVAVSLLLVIFTMLSLGAFGWLLGVLTSLLVALFYGSIADFKLLQHIAQKLYIRIEDYLIKIIKKVPLLFSLLRNVSNIDSAAKQRVGSREELQHIIDESKNVLSPEDKLLIVNGLSFNDQLVSGIMTPRPMIDYVKKSEFLGPLTLDKLYKNGHSRLPVINGDIDHIVGILNIKTLLALDVKRSTTAEKAMDPKVYYIRVDQTLQDALAAFLHTKSHLLVVVNESKETEGLLALEDVIEALLGRKVTNDFDAYDNLRAVSLNAPKSSDKLKDRKND